LLANLTAHDVDLDETRRQFEARAAADLTLANEGLAQAGAEALGRRKLRARIERDHLDGRITAEQWQRLERKLRPNSGRHRRRSSGLRTT
jgi:hypothetical protein